MPYIKETCICGNVVEVRKYYSARYKKSCVRKKATSVTSEKVKKNNRKYAEMKLRRILNENFKKGDYHVQLLYLPQNRPTEESEAKKIIKNCLRRVAYHMKKDGKEFKFIYCTGKGKKRNNFHHHIVVQKEALEYLNKQWQMGRVFSSMIYSENLYKLAEYFILHSDRFDEDNRRKYNMSKNIVIPLPKKEIVRADSWRDIPKAPKGYYLDTDSVDEGICEFTGYPYQNYNLIRIE